MQLPKKPKMFYDFLLHFWNLDQILSILKAHQAHGSTASDNVDLEISCYLNVLQAMFLDTLGHSKCWLVPNTGEV